MGVWASGEPGAEGGFGGGRGGEAASEGFDADLGPQVVVESDPNKFASYRVRHVRDVSTMTPELLTFVLQVMLAALVGVVVSPFLVLGVVWWASRD